MKLVEVVGVLLAAPHRQVACLLLCAVVSQAQFYATYGYYPRWYRDAIGNQPIGSYSYINPEGKEVRLKYDRGVDGFRVDPNRLNADEFMLRDELGQASFGYAHPEQTAVNYRDAFGNQVGSYAYINPEGKEIRVSYTADSRGRGVLSNDLAVGPSADLVAPEPVQDTAEVAEAEAAHTAAVAAARSGNHPAAPVMTVMDLPALIQDTAEVALAEKKPATALAAAEDALLDAYLADPSLIDRYIRFSMLESKDDFLKSLGWDLRVIFRGLRAEYVASTYSPRELGGPRHCSGRC